MSSGSSPSSVRASFGVRQPPATDALRDVSSNCSLLRTGSSYARTASPSMPNNGSNRWLSVSSSMRSSGAIVPSRHCANPVVADARFGSLVFNIDTGTPKIAAISSTISSRPVRSFGGNDIGCNVRSALVKINLPTLSVPRSVSLIATSRRSSSSSLGSPLTTPT